MQATDIPILWSDTFQEHIVPARFPERPERIANSLEHLRAREFRLIDCMRTPKGALLNNARALAQATHAPKYIERFERAAGNGEPGIDTEDNPLSPGTPNAVWGAVHAALAAGDTVLDEAARNERAGPPSTFALARPPGHHCEYDRAMGFCYLNQAAILAEGALEHYGLSRIAVVDFDVHHGNGTQHLFEDRSDVYYVSTHQAPFYPHTGDATERGKGAGEGYTLNIPLEAGTGDERYRRVFEEQILPALTDYQPQLIIASAGFDAWQRDPLGGMKLTEEAFFFFWSNLGGPGPRVLRGPSGFRTRGRIRPGTPASTRRGLPGGYCQPVEAQPSPKLGLPLIASNVQMKLPSTLKEALQEGRYDDVESEWLERVNTTPTDVDTFVDVAEWLVKNDEEIRAQSLLEILDDELKSGGNWGDRLDLIRKSGRHYLRTGRVHEVVMETIENHYGAAPDRLELMMSTVGLDKDKDETPKLWDKVERLRSLFAFEPGTIVFMKDKGVGTVKDVNLALQKLKVDFEKAKGLSVGFRAAGSMLELVPEGHFLRRKVEEPEVLKALEPSELLRTVMESYKRPLSGSEVREAVAGLVETKKWASWWTKARKHPQVIAEGGKKQTYRWAESSEDAEESLWEAFEKAKHKQQLDLLRRAANQDEGLRKRMAKHLAGASEALQSKDPALAFETWHALERIGEAPAWSPGGMVKDLRDPRKFATSLSNRTLREKAYKVIAENREDAPSLLHGALQGETEPKALSLLSDLIGEFSIEARDKAIDAATSQPRKGPAAFTWVVERAAESEDLRNRRGLRILRQTMSAVSDEVFAPFHVRLGTQCDSGGAIPRILSHLDENEAKDAERAITGSVGLESYRRDPLLEALYLRFPNLSREEEEPLYTTQENYDAKREELRALLEEEIPANRKAIEEARELGDLRENFEYKSARQRHEYLASFASNLNAQVERAKVLQPGSIDTTEARVGTRLLLSGEGKESSLTILGPWESDPEKGVISYESDLAKKAIGSKVGEEIEMPDGTYKVVSIEAFA